MFSKLAYRPNTLNGTSIYCEAESIDGYANYSFNYLSSTDFDNII